MGPIIEEGRHKIKAVEVCQIRHTKRQGKWGKGTKTRSLILSPQCSENMYWIQE